MITCVKRLSGYNHVSYCINYNDKELILKFTESMEALKQIKIKQLLPNFPIANILYYNEKLVIMEKLQGVSMKENYDETVIQSLGEVYGMLHGIKFKSYGPLLSNSGYNDWVTHQGKKIEKVLTKLKNQKFVQYYRDHKYLLELETEPCLCHGDFSLSNILTQNHKITGIIDFEFARRSGAIKELANNSISNNPSFIRGYLKYSKLPSGWRKLLSFYKWIKNVKTLSEIDSMTWQGLTKEETIERRNKIKSKIYKLINSSLDR